MPNEAAKDQRRGRRREDITKNSAAEGKTIVDIWAEEFRADLLAESPGSKKRNSQAQKCGNLPDGVILAMFTEKTNRRGQISTKNAAHGEVQAAINLTAARVDMTT